MTLNDLRPKSHPLHGFFKEHKVTTVMIARHINYSLARTAQFLLGYDRTPPHVEMRLQELRKLVEKEAAKAA